MLQALTRIKKPDRTPSPAFLERDCSGKHWLELPTLAGHHGNHVRELFHKGAQWGDIGGLARAGSHLHPNQEEQGKEGGSTRAQALGILKRNYSQIGRASCRERV